jgi:hypothetical protein
MYSFQVMSAVRQYLGAEDGHDTNYDGQIAQMSQREVLDTYLNWHGIIGYTSSIIDVVGNIYNIELR